MKFIGFLNEIENLHILIEEIIEGKQAKENHNFCCLGKQKETKYHQLFTFIVSSVWTYKFEFGENNLDGNSSIDVTVF